MSTFPKYPAIALLPRRPEILAVKKVIATEKLHGCVVGKTRVSLADGSRKAISALVVGDTLLGVDEGGRVVTSEVTHTYNNGKAEKWLKISGTRRGAGRGNHDFTLRCTPEHHVWHAAQRQYITAGELRPGDPILMLRSELGLTPLQEQVLIGKMLGDGSLSSIAESAHLSWGHRAVDVEYTRWTSRALGDLDSGSEGAATSGYGSPMLRRRTISNVFIKTLLGDFLGEDGVKHVPTWVASRLTPLSLAFWYMDDGSLAHSEGQEDRASFAVCGFNEADCKVLVAGLARLGVEAVFRTDTEGYARLYLGSDAAEALFLLVAPYIPPCMQRKLPERYRGHEGWLPSSDNVYKRLLTEQVVTSIEEDAEISSNRYDIETTTHNYFANGLLVHNSTFRLHFPIGMENLDAVRYGSHEMEYDPANPGEFPLRNAIRWFQARPELLNTMWETLKTYDFPDATVFGEAYGPGIKSKGVKYSLGQDMLFRAFGIMVGENFLTYELFVEVTEKMGLPRAHKVWEGEPTVENFDALLEKVSVEGKLNGIDDENNKAEGVVIQSEPLLRNVFGEWLIVKHKSARFTEVAHAPTAPKEKTESPADAFVATYVTEGRLLNAIGRVQDRGTVLSNSMKDMPTLLAEMVADLHKECEPEWVATGCPEAALKGAVSRVLGPLYREILARG